MFPESVRQRLYNLKRMLAPTRQTIRYFASRLALAVDRNFSAYPVRSAVRWW